MDNQAKLGAHVVLFNVQKNKSKIFALLLKNGVVLPKNASDIDTAKIVTETLKKSKSFRKDFEKFNANEQYATYIAESFASSNGFSYEPLPSSFDKMPSGASLTSTTSNTSSPSGSSSFWSSSNLSSILNKGLDAYLTLDTNKTNRALADASIIQSKSGISPTSYAGNAGEKAPTKNNTTMYVLLGILGVALIGGTIWAISKSKK